MAGKTSKLFFLKNTNHLFSIFKGIPLNRTWTKYYRILHHHEQSNLLLAHPDHVLFSQHCGVLGWGRGEVYNEVNTLPSSPSHKFVQAVKCIQMSVNAGNFTWIFFCKPSCIYKLVSCWETSLNLLLMEPDAMFDCYHRLICLHVLVV